MRFLALIEDAPVIGWILRHSGAWGAFSPLPAPPVEKAWPDHSQLPLTCRPVADIA